MLSLRSRFFLLVFVVVLGTPAQAQSDPYYIKQVHDSLMGGSPLHGALNHNYQLLQDGYWRGYIQNGKDAYQTASFHLTAGYIYTFVGACDSDCADMDFYMYDGRGNLVTQDTDPDDTPVVTISVGQTGDFTLVSKIPKCNGIIGCYWAVQAVWK